MFYYEDTEYNTEEEDEDSGGCKHENMEQTVRTDYCPDCGYSCYYPSSH